ncbi:MAG: LysR family transcriptional regulator [Xanthobacteraceae bacterium]
MHRRASRSPIATGNHRSPLGNRIPLTSLIQTLAVAEHLNFRHAAHALGVSLSSVSARVKTLEETLAFSCSSVMRAVSG